MKRKPTYAEFFCGGGMVTAALRDRWACVFANDIDAMKCATFRANWGDDVLHEGDVRDVAVSDLTRPIDLYWGSSPCQDFSLAGKGRGLGGARSGVVTPWLDLIAGAVQAGHAPRLVAFENVTGLLTRRGGADLTQVLDRLVRIGYRVGCLVLDAADFLPQSRPRLFVIALRDGVPVPDGLEDSGQSYGATPAVARFHAMTSARVRRAWINWHLPTPPLRNTHLRDLVEMDGTQGFYDAAKLRHLTAMMDPPSRARLDAARQGDTVTCGTLYRRGRPDAAGQVRQRAEVRFDGIAGCLRTPAGGSSRQTLVLAGQGKVRMRLLSAREAMRLMGLDDTYQIPDRYNDAYKIAGDGVAVPVVAYLDQHLFQPLIAEAAVPKPKASAAA